MFRVLGVAALFLGVLFSVIAFLVLLPFLSNFSTSLLVLAGVFGVFAYVFLAIGWQLFHPPSRRRGSIEEAADEVRWASVSADADEHVIGAPSSVDNSVTSGEGMKVADHTALVFKTGGVSEELVEKPLSGSVGVLAADSEPIVDTPSSTFSGFAPVPQGGEPRLGAVHEPGSGHNGRRGNGGSSERARFKKPGYPVPEQTGVSGAGAL